MWSRCRRMRGNFWSGLRSRTRTLIDGIAPAVAIRQKNTTRNPRSTVATATEIYDYLRLLFARVGRTYCANCGREVKKDTVDEVADAILSVDPETRLQVLFPLQRAWGGTGNRRKSVRVRGRDSPTTGSGPTLATAGGTPALPKAKKGARGN